MAGVHSFTRPAQDGAVAALQANHYLPCRAVLAEAAVDFLLCDLAVPVALANTLNARAWRNQLEYLRCQEVVVKNDIGLSENSKCLEREQFRIARPGSDQIDMSGLLGG